jgi:hypothetical protein
MACTHMLRIPGATGAANHRSALFVDVSAHLFKIKIIFGVCVIICFLFSSFLFPVIV